MKEGPTTREIILAAYASWYTDGSNRGADEEVMQDIGVHSPERVLEILGRTLDAAGVAIDETAADVSSAPATAARNQVRARKRRIPMSRRILMFVDIGGAASEHKSPPYGHADPDA